MKTKKPVDRRKKTACFVLGCSIGILCTIVAVRIEHTSRVTASTPTPTATVEIALTPTPTPIPTPAETPIVTPEPEPIDYSVEAEYIAKTIYGEARGCPPDEQKQVVWCILNRVDNDNPYFPDNIIDVIVQPWQFHGYNENNPVEPEHYELALDVLAQWEIEKAGGESERNLAPEYLFFYGDGKHNYFRTTY